MVDPGGGGGSLGSDDPLDVPSSINTDSTVSLTTAHRTRVATVGSFANSETRDSGLLHTVIHTLPERK